MNHLNLILIISSVFVLCNCSTVPTGFKNDPQSLMKLTLLNKAINNGKNSAKISSPEDFGNFIKNLSTLKQTGNPRCLSCFNAAYECYYSEGSWFNSECTNAYSACLSCGMTLTSVIGMIGK